MADMHTHLLPCPHCGGEAEFSQTGRHEMTLKCVGVQPSGLRGCGPLYRQRVLPNRHTLDWLQGVMAETWNRRTPSHDAETIKALEAKLTAIRNKIPMNYLRRHDVDGATGPTSECDIVAAMADYSADRWKYIDRVAAAEKSAKAMREALDECEAYFDNRSDVSDGDYGIPEPNEEMRLLTMVRSAQERAV